jgi:membrane protease YdiL (CAAX protease family)
VNRSPYTDPPAVSAVALLHQEGVLAVIALVGLALRQDGPVAALAPTGGMVHSVSLGLTAGLAGSLLLWLARPLPAMKRLLRFQHRLVRNWTVSDALSVALLSGIAEEALLRALLQPLIGLVPAAVLFALLHLVPDRRLWLWPVIACALGLLLGVLYQRGGYPAAATAHIAVNVCALLRLRRLAPET